MGGGQKKERLFRFFSFISALSQFTSALSQSQSPPALSQLYLGTEIWLSPPLEEIQRKSRVREWTQQNAPRIRAGVEKKDQKAELKKNQTRRCYAEKNLDFFSDDRQTPARREARNHRSEDAKMLGPPPCGPQRAGRADQRYARGDAHRDRNSQNPRRSVLLCATQRPRSANDKTTTMTRHPELRDPRSDPSDDRSRKLARSLVEWH